MASATPEEEDGTSYDTRTEFELLVDRGDILEQRVDVILNLVSPDLVRTKGLWSYWASMSEIQDECQAKAPGGLEYGEYVVTNGGEGFTAKYIYHLACVDEATKEVDFEIYRNALAESLENANAMELSSMAVPIIDVDRFKDEQCPQSNADIALQLYYTFRALSQDQNKLHTLTVKLMDCSSDKSLYSVYKDVMKQMRRSTPSTQSLQSKESEIAKEQEEPASPSMIRGITDVTSPVTNINSFSTQNSSSEIQVYSRQSSSGSEHGYGNDVRPKTRAKGQNVNVDIYSGDLTKERTDAIVHPTKFTGRHIDTTGRLGRALMHAGGEDFKRLCAHTGRHHQIEIEVTRGGNLPSRNVIHVNIDKCHSDANWVDRIFKYLKKAESRKFKSIAFPAMGSRGSSDVDKARNFQQAIDEFKRSSAQHLEWITIVLLGSSSTTAFKDIISSSTPSTAGKRSDQTASGSDIQVFTSRYSPGPSSTLTAKTYKSVKIMIKEGDVTLEHGDCIVHGVQVYTGFNGFIPLNDGVGKALKAQGGDEFTTECQTKGIYKNAYAITKGGSMACKNILHMDTTDYVNKYKKWDDFISRCLNAAQDYDMGTVMFPLIGAAGTSIVEHAKKQMYGIRTFIDSYQSSTKLKEVRFVLYNNQKGIDAFSEALQHIGQLQKQAQAGPTGSKSHTGNNGAIGVRKGSGKISEIKIVIAEDDIANNTCDMIVHGTSSSSVKIPLDDPIGKVLSTKGGKDFNDECSKCVLKANEYTITRSGHLKCKKVLHLDIANLNSTNKWLWKQRLETALFGAEMEQVSSLAFPPLGTLDSDQQSWKNMATIFKETLEKFNTKRKTAYVKMVEIIIYKNTPLFRVFVSMISSKSSQVSAEPRKGGKIQIKGLMSTAELEVVEGDITDETSNAIVHATNNKWSLNHTAIGRAIKKKGGQTLEDALSATNKNGKTTCVTSSGKLKCKLVMHLDTTVSTKVKDLVYACLVEARNSNITSLSFPALGTGKTGIDPKTIANDFKWAIHRFYQSQETNKLTQIRIVIFEKSMKDTFIDVIQGLNS